MSVTTDTSGDAATGADKVAMFAKLTVRDGMVGEFIERLHDLLAGVEQEDGTLVYAAHRSAKEPNVIWFYELYQNREALRVHGANAEAALGSLLDDYLAARPELIRAEPILAKGLDIG